MLRDKEYPATHSMDTAWFAVDLDGNVAIFQFEEDGPGPIPFTDIHTNELIQSYLAQMRFGIDTLDFSDEQIGELMSSLHNVKDFEEISGNSLVAIDPAKKYSFLEYVNCPLCVSDEHGLYYVEWWKEKYKWQIQQMINDKVIRKGRECDIEIYFDDIREDQSEHRLAYFPFFVYEQNNRNKAPERVVTPKYPLMESQLPKSAKDYTLHLPVHFKDDKYVEPSEFIDSQCWSYNNNTKEVDGVKYMQVALTHGGFGYVKIIDHYYSTPVYPDNWDKAPRVIDKSDHYDEPHREE